MSRKRRVLLFYGLSLLLNSVFVAWLGLRAPNWNAQAAPPKRPLPILIYHAPPTPKPGLPKATKPKSAKAAHAKSAKATKPNAAGHKPASKAAKSAAKHTAAKAGSKSPKGSAKKQEAKKPGTQRTAVTPPTPSAVGPHAAGTGPKTPGTPQGHAGQGAHGTRHTAGHGHSKPLTGGHAATSQQGQHGTAGGQKHGAQTMPNGAHGAAGHGKQGQAKGVGKGQSQTSKASPSPTPGATQSGQAGQSGQPGTGHAAAGNAGQASAVLPANSPLAGPSTNFNDGVANSGAVPQLPAHKDDPPGLTPGYQPAPPPDLIIPIGSHSLLGTIPMPPDPPLTALQQVQQQAIVPPVVVPDPTHKGDKGDGSGLLGEYYTGKDFDKFAFSRADRHIEFIWTGTLPDPRMPPATAYSVRWTGKVVPRYSETYTFLTTSDDGVRLWVDGKRLVDNWTIHGAVENSGQIALQAGQAYDLRLEFFEKNGVSGTVIDLYWQSPSQPKEFIPEDRLRYPNQ